MIEKLIARSHNEGGCLIWDGPTDKGGYAVLSSSRVHILTWESVNGPVSAGLELDHTCNRRSCINPAHCEPVTHAENCRRAAERRSMCRAGHDLRNARLQRNGGRIQRVCQECYEIRYERRWGHRPGAAKAVAA